MKGTRSATRYAKSLIDLSTETNVLEEVKADMELIASTVSQSHDLTLFLQSPIVKSDKKQDALNAVFPNLSNLTQKFVEIIVSKGRESILGYIAEEFLAQLKIQKGIVVASIKSAVQLDETLKTKILSLIDTDNKQIEVIEKIDPKLLGGFIVQVDDKQIDASIATRITELKLEFSKNAYISEL